MGGATPFPLSRPMARAILRGAAGSGSRVVFTRHALGQMRKRRISPTQVLGCLVRGRIVEGPALGMKGAWECRVEGIAEGRGIAVAVAIMPPDGVVIITAFWLE